MIRLIQRKLIIPRGDSGSFAIPPIASSEDAIAVFAILDPSTNKKVFSKIIEDVAETINVSFTHDETVNLPCGKFLWDIKYYTEPIIVDGELIGGTEVDSYYAAYTMPECEVRQTADNLLTADGSPETTLTPDAIDAITAALNEIDSKMAEIEEMSGHAPIIQNGEWYIWDTDTGAYIDSGVSATGPEGPQGETGPTGETGAPGPKGNPGEGVPTGGAEGDVLTKSGAADYATEWTVPAVTAAQFAALQAQVDALYPTKSVGPAAAVAVDDALAGNAQGLTVVIEPVQEGSGDPSPDNVRPISGWTGANVQRTGKNLYNSATFTTITRSGVTCTNNGDGSFTLNGTATNDTYFDIFRPQFAPTLGGTPMTNAEYCLSGCPSGGSSQNYFLYTTPNYYSDYGSGKVFTDSVTGGSIFVKNGYTCNNLVFRPQICFASAPNPTEFTSYQGNTYTIQMPTEAGTVYGGTLDVVIGTLTAYPYYASYAGEPLVGPWVSSMDAYVAGATPTIGAQVLDIGGTPITYQLTQQQIALLRGNNTVWADTGDTTLTYKQDIALLLSKLDSTT